MTSSRPRSVAELRQRIDDAMGISQRWAAARCFVETRPKTALFVLAACAGVIVPLAIFLFVVGSSLLAGLTMLLCFQGAILTTATALLLPTLAFCLLCAGGVTVLAYGSQYILGAAFSIFLVIYNFVWPYAVAAVWGLNNLNLRGKLGATIPTVDCKVTRRVDHDGMGHDVFAQGDYPRVHARLVYHPEPIPITPESIQQAED